MNCLQNHQGESASLRRKLIGALIGLSRATEGNEHLINPSTVSVTIEGLTASHPCTKWDADKLLTLLSRVDTEKRKLVPDCYHCTASCGRTDAYNLERLENVPAEAKQLKSEILTAICNLATQCNLQAVDESVQKILFLGLFAIGMEDWDTEELLPILEQCKTCNR